MKPEEEARLLEALLFDREVSRNRQFERFEEGDAKRLHRRARLLRSIKSELQQPEVRFWTEPSEDGGICLHLHRPHIGMLRQIRLTDVQWSMLFHPRWENT